jgi:hypothetical protein
LQLLDRSIFGPTGRPVRSARDASLERRQRFGTEPGKLLRLG